MMGLAFIAAFIIYLIISIVVIRLVVRWAKRRGRRPVLWGIIAVFIMYNLVFWDFIPTYALYKYYCATKAGFWVYKTPEEWKKENPGVAEMLTWKDSAQDFVLPGMTSGYRLNERFVWAIKRSSIPIIPVRISQNLIVDTETEEIMLRQVSVGAGYSDGRGFIRLWTVYKPCMPHAKEFYNLESEFERLGRKSQ